MEDGDSFGTALHGAPLSEELAARLDEDFRDRLLWTMAEAATRAGGLIVESPGAIV